MRLFLIGDAATGMQGIISQLTTGITVDTLFSVVSNVIPFVIVMVMASFGFYVLRKVIKKASKGKAGI